MGSTRGCRHCARRNWRQQNRHIYWHLQSRLRLSARHSPSTRQHGRITQHRCKSFDAAADGYVRGEGCGLVVLKRLSDALKDDDRILGLILGSATNQDGRTNGLTAPKASAQIEVIRDALGRAKIEPKQISYV